MQRSEMNQDNSLNSRNYEKKIIRKSYNNFILSRVLFKKSLDERRKDESNIK